MRTIALLVLTLVPLASCSTIRKAEELLDQGTRLAQTAEVSLSKVNQTLAGVQVAAASMGEKGKEIAEKVSEVKSLAQRSDLNEDGKIRGFSEWKELLYGLVLLVIGWFGKKGIDKRVEQVDERLTRGKRDIHSRISMLSNGRGGEQSS